MKRYAYKLLDRATLQSYSKDNSLYPDQPLVYVLERVLNHLGNDGWKVIHFQTDAYVSELQVLLIREVVPGYEGNF